jgi:N-methylhydantoinase A/oxoprolinase/acetone carboxylase beta subunit
VLEQQLDVRYVGQSYEITLPLTADYASEFHRLHGRLYGYSNESRPLEVVAVRVRAAGLTEKPKLPSTKPRRPWRPKAAQTRQGLFGGKKRQTAFFRWPDLGPGATGVGPAVVTGPEATVVIPPDFRFDVDRYGNVISRRRSASTRAAVEK